MNKHFQHIIETIEPFEDSDYGSRYRCSLTLKDGTYLPCAVLQSKQKLVELAKRRIREEMDGKGCLGGADPYRHIVSSFVTRLAMLLRFIIIAMLEKAGSCFRYSKVVFFPMTIKMYLYCAKESTLLAPLKASNNPIAHRPYGCY
jgi:hypothetical protein